MGYPQICHLTIIATDAKAAPAQTLPTATQTMCKIHPFSKNTVTFEVSMQFWRKINCDINTLFID